MQIRKEVLQAVVKRKEENQAQHIKAKELQKDILNIPNHIFGEHKRCKERGRTCISSVHKKSINYVPYLKLYGLYQKVDNAVMYLNAHSDSLLLSVTNNPAESFNSIICKEIDGKRINFGNRGSYNARVAGAVVQHNRQALMELYVNMCKDVPSITENLEKRRQIKIMRMKVCREMSGKKTKLKIKAGTDKHYGPQSQRPDLSQEVFEKLRENHLNKLFEHGENWEQIGGIKCYLS